MNRPRRFSPETLGLLVFAGLSVVPVVLGQVYALGYSLGWFGALQETVQSGSVSGFLLDREIWDSLLVSTYVAAAVVLLTAVISMFLGLYLRRVLTRGLLSYLVYLPPALPAVVAAFFTFQLLSDAGLVSRVAASMGWIQNPSEFPSLIHDHAFIGVITAHLIAAIPFFSLYFSQVYQDARLDAYLDLTRSLGGKPWDGLRHVVWPVFIRRGTPQLMLWFILVFGSYEIPLLLARQSPQMISVLTMRKFQMFDLTTKPQAFTAALVYSLVVIVLLIILYRKRDGDFHV